MITKLLVSVIFPVLILLILNLRIMITICMSSRKIRENENSRKFDKIGNTNDKNALMILICLVTMFLICHMFRFMLIIHEFIFLDAISNCLFDSTISNFFPQWIYILITLSEFTIILNSSSNFFVYLLAGKKFRKELFKIILLQNSHARRKYFSENPESNQRWYGRILSKQNTSTEEESGKCLKKQSTFETRV